jgi:hypothetical protein
LSFRKDYPGYNLSQKVAGIIQADDLNSLKRVLGNVYEAAKGGGHPLLLPIQLFETHFIDSQKQFKDILQDINKVASKIAKDLSKDKSWVDKIKDHEYAELNQKLHVCGISLVELERRRDFERRLGHLLVEELENERIDLVKLANEDAETWNKRDLHIQRLLQRVVVYAAMSKNRDLDINNLPWRIESQRNVVSALQ